MYKIWFQYTNLFKRYQTETIFRTYGRDEEDEKSAITPITGGLYPKSSLTYILYLCIYM